MDDSLISSDKLVDKISVITYKKDMDVMERSHGEESKVDWVISYGDT